MKITPIDHGLDLLASDLVRSPGIHLSEIYNNLYAELEPRRYGRDEPNTLMMAMGSAWETHVELLLRHAGVPAQRPQEFRSPEGIAFSPDLLIQQDVLRLGEIKLKYLSSRDMPRRLGESFPPKMNKTLTQIMNYCHLLETPHARLYTLHVCGDYKKPLQPELLTWDIEFSPRELRDEWAMVLHHAQHRKLLK